VNLRTESNNTDLGYKGSFLLRNDENKKSDDNAMMDSNKMFTDVMGSLSISHQSSLVNLKRSTLTDADVPELKYTDIEESKSTIHHRFDGETIDLPTNS